MAETPAEVVRALTEREAQLLAPMFASYEFAAARVADAQREQQAAQQILVNSLELAVGDAADMQFDFGRRVFTRKPE